METIPWDRLSVDLIGPYISRRKVHDKPHILKDLTMIDPSTGWFEIVQYNNKQADTISNLVEKMWLCRYPCPRINTYNHGIEFLVQALKMTLLKTNMELNTSVKLQKTHK